MRLYSLLALVMLAGCARYPWQIEPTYVPDATYAALSCADLSTELTSIRATKDTLYEAQTTRANLDSFFAGFVGVTPTLLNLKGNHEDLLASLSGAELAVQRVMIARPC